MICIETDVDAVKWKHKDTRMLLLRLFFIAAQTAQVAWPI